MSTRYVWGKYNIKGQWEGPFLTKWYHIPLYPPAGSSAQWNAGYFSTGILANSEFGSGGKGTLNSEFLSVAVAQKSGQYTNRARSVYAPYSTEVESYATCIDGVKNSDDYVWYIGPDATGSGWALTCLDAATMKTYYDIKYFNRVEIAGTFIENVSSPSDSKYAQAYELLVKAQRHASTLPAPDWAKAELREAMDSGITDGSEPMRLAMRYETAIMTKRAAKG